MAREMQELQAKTRMNDSAHLLSIHGTFLDKPIDERLDMRTSSLCAWVKQMYPVAQTGIYKTLTNRYTGVRHP
jgi:hypothetical protein